MIAFPEDPWSTQTSTTFKSAEEQAEDLRRYTVSTSDTTYTISSVYSPPQGNRHERRKAEALARRRSK